MNERCGERDTCSRQTGKVDNELSGEEKQYWKLARDDKKLVSFWEYFSLKITFQFWILFFKEKKKLSLLIRALSVSCFIFTHALVPPIFQMLFTLFFSRPS